MTTGDFPLHVQVYAAAHGVEPGSVEPTDINQDRVRDVLAAALSRPRAVDYAHLIGRYLCMTRPSTPEEIEAGYPPTSGICCTVAGVEDIPAGVSINSDDGLSFPITAEDESSWRFEIHADDPNPPRKVRESVEAHELAHLRGVARHVAESRASLVEEAGVLISAEVEQMLAEILGWQVRGRVVNTDNVS